MCKKGQLATINPSFGPCLQLGEEEARQEGVRRRRDVAHVDADGILTHGGHKTISGISVLRLNFFVSF